MYPEELIAKLAKIIQDHPETKHYKMSVVVNVGRSDVDLLLDPDAVINASFQEIQLMVEE